MWLFAGMVAVVKTHSTKAGIVIHRLLVGLFQARWEDARILSELRRSQEGLPCREARFRHQLLPVRSRSALASGLWLLQLIGGVLLLCETAVPARSFQAFSVQLFDYKEAGRGSIVVLQRRKKRVTCLCISLCSGERWLSHFPFRNSQICIECL